MAPRSVKLSLAGVACSSAGVLVFEIVLTRIFSLTQFYHFAFLTVSLALLGFGASGSVLAAWPRLGRGGPRRWALLASIQGVTTLGAYAVTNRIPFDSFAIAWDRRQVWYLVAYYLALAVPFFFGGAVIGTLLSGWDQPQPLPSNRVYGASLIGAGLGCVIAIGGLALVGGVGIIVIAAALGLASAALFAASVPLPPRHAAVAAIAVAIAAGGIVMAGLEPRLSPYKDLSAALRYPGSAVASTSWESSVRIDHVVSPGIRSVPGLSFAWGGSPPPQDGITFDGDDLSAAPLVGPGGADFASHVLNSVAFSLRPGGEVLVLEPRGGLDVLVALASGAGAVTAVESHGPAVEAAQRNGSVYHDARVEIVIDEPRSFVERTVRRFDVIDLALAAPYRPVTSGAYSLAENYGLTAEAFDAYLSLLRPGGIITSMRWLQTPPSETIRLLALAAEAVDRGGGDAAESVIALRGYATGLVMVKQGPFTSGEVTAVLDFAARERFDVIVAPGASPSNRFNVLPDDAYAALATRLLSDPDQLYGSYDFDIEPPTDNQPFFTHFFKWAQASTVLDTIGRTWQPFGGAGFFVLLALLALSTLGAAVLIIGPLLAVRARGTTTSRGTRAWTVAYFGLLGLAFLLVELPLVQHYILLVGRPTTALAIVLFAILLAAGAGSIVSRRIPWRRAALTLTAAAFVYSPLVKWATGALLATPLVVRMALGALMLAPLGFLMGIMFPKGIARLEETAPHLVPWAWGVNGTMSVIAAAASALLTLTWGFQLVVWVGALCYAGTVLLVRAAATGPVSSLPG